MLASSPTTRMVPPAIALVNGDSRGSKNRRYGSSDVFENRTVSSASIGRSTQSVQSRTYEPRRRGFELRRKSSPRSESRPVSCPMPFVAGEQIVHAQAHVVPGNLERARSRRGELQEHLRTARAGTEPSRVIRQECGRRPR